MCKAGLDPILKRCRFPSHQSEARRAYNAVRPEAVRRWKRNEYRKNRTRYQSWRKSHYAENVSRYVRWERERSIRLKFELVTLLGASCVRCGRWDIPELLQFDHIVPARSFTNGRRRLEEVKLHPERFQLLCPNCHRRKTNAEMRLHLDGKAARRKALALPLLGGVCSWCAEPDPEVLEFDHVEAFSGAKGPRADECLRHPERFQLLCATCHATKTADEKRTRFTKHGTA